MGKVCECCGRKNNAWRGDKFYLTKDKFLCFKCAEPIKSDIDKILSAKYTEKQTLKEKILIKCKRYYSDEITSYIENKINDMCKKNEFSKSESISMSENIQSIGKLITFLGIVSSAAVGIHLIFDKASVTIGIIVILAGNILSWIIGYLIKAFGFLLKNTEEILKQLKK